MAYGDWLRDTVVLLYDSYAIKSIMCWVHYVTNCDKLQGLIIWYSLTVRARGRRPKRAHYETVNDRDKM